MNAAPRPDLHTAEAQVPPAAVVEQRQAAGTAAAEGNDQGNEQPRPIPKRLPPAGPQPLLPAITGLALLAIPFALGGETSSWLTAESGQTSAGPEVLEQILVGSRVGFDLLLVLAGVFLAWRSPADRRGFWRFGIWPLLAGLAAIGGSALLLTLEQEGLGTLGLAVLGRALAGLGTGTLTIYWLRMNTGSVRVPAHGPSVPQRIRTSRTAPLLAFTTLLFCAARPDVLAAAYLLPLHFASAWLVVTLVRAPHSPLTRLLDRLGKTVQRNQPHRFPETGQGPVRRQILLPDPPAERVCATTDPGGPTAQSEQTFHALNQTRPDAEVTVETAPATPNPATDPSGTTEDQGDNTRSIQKTYVAPSGRVIDLAQIPAELRLLPLPGRTVQKAGQKEQRVEPDGQTE
ncbi:hypothetical protein LWF15_16400 [Kineosporia rhizophila]|uniref:hypothetical protein n=1 Tax=Kineosporia rhizophila TaxID=84633 RepID=UPI001E332915|nr:hypothetical protein [Kineosporia rhizophila]MCE0537084.1 hypothetical protein [Kineosporia rhizophila]